MLQLADDLRVLPSRPSFAFNAYLAGDVLVDAGTRHAHRRIERALGDYPLRAHAVTHAHADHQGSSRAICDARGIPCWAPAGEADAMAQGDLDAMSPSNAVTRWQHRHWAGPAVPVARQLAEGDELAAGFVALNTPGHSPGHMSYWREADRVLIAGDVLFGRHPVHGRPGLHEPPRQFTIDPERNRASIRCVAELAPELIVFGHGPPRRAPAAELRALAAMLS